jgi:glycosyltransferase involved in cell wall biosynthesis
MDARHLSWLARERGASTAPWRALRERLGRGGRIALLISDLVPFDAASADTVAWQRVLRRAGIDAPIYGRTVVRGHGGRAAPLDRYRPRAGDLVVLKYTVWSEAAEWVQRAAGRHVLVYHNVTPPHFFALFDPRLARDARRGRAELTSLAPKASLGLANSDFSRQDLVAAGFARSDVLPILLDEPTASPDPAVLNALADGRTNVLYVGRIAPNKRVERSIAAFAYYRHRIDRDARLLLVGEHDANGPYMRALRRLVGQLDLEGAVRFTGQVPADALSAYWRSAHVFLTMSEHEGFCVPLVEAMRGGVPIVARAAAAIPETAGDAALLVDEDRPELVAELLHLARSDADLRRTLVARGRARAELYAPERTEATLARQLVEALQAR